MLSDKVRDDQLIIVDSLVLEQPKTKEMVRVLELLDASLPVLLVADGADASVLRSTRNIPRVKMIPASLLNTLDLLQHRNIVMTLDALRKVEELWGGRLVRRNRKLAGVSEEG